MILHMAHEIPEKQDKTLDAEVSSFTPEETRILKAQIRKNNAIIDDHVRRIDLFVNHENHASREVLVKQLQERLFLLMEENDTFRTVLWKQYQNLGVV